MRRRNRSQARGRQVKLRPTPPPARSSRGFSLFPLAPPPTPAHLALVIAVAEPEPATAPPQPEINPARHQPDPAANLPLNPAPQPLPDSPNPPELRTCGKPWTSEAARLAAVKSAEVRRANKLERLIAAQREAQKLLLPPLPKPEHPTPLGIVSDEIQRLGKTLAGKLKPAERMGLIKSLDLLLDRQRILEGKALPSRQAAVVAPEEPTGSTRLLLGTPPSPAPGQRTGREDQE